MKRFHVGQKVVVVRCEDPNYIGLVTTVTSLLQSITKYDTEDKNWETWPLGTLVHAVSEPHPSPRMILCFPPNYLEPYRNDGNVRGRWTKELRRLCSAHEAVKS